MIAEHPFVSAQWKPTTPIHTTPKRTHACAVKTHTHRADQIHKGWRTNRWTDERLAVCFRQTDGQRLTLLAHFLKDSPVHDITTCNHDHQPLSASPLQPAGRPLFL